MLSRDFREFAELLNSAGVEYLVVGGYPAGRIDLLSSIDGVDFDACWARRMVVDVAALRLSILALEDFRANQRAVGRPKDLADLASLDEPPEA